MLNRTKSGPLPLHRFGGGSDAFAIGDFDSIGPLSRADFPHRHTFYEIVHVSSGTGSHVVDQVAHSLRPPCFYVVRPGQVHFWQHTGLQGHVILFTEAFLSAYPADRERLQMLSGQPIAAAGCTSVLSEMLSEHALHPPGFASVLQAYLHVLVQRLSRHAGAVAPGQADRVTVLAHGFSSLLSASNGRRHTVRECAARLGVSQAYLTEVVRSVTGHTPAQMIRQAQVLEAQRLLAGTALTVAQIAVEVSFADPAYFCRFFRRETGVTPGEFRRRNHHSSRIDSIDAHD